MDNYMTGYNFTVKDPISALTHFIGFWLSLAAMPLLLIKAASCGSGVGNMIGFAVFMISMVLLYGASTAHHTFILPEKQDKLFKKIDHMMIFILIAGSYTPVCMIVLRNDSGWKLLAAVWLIAAVGIAFKALWVTCPKWVSSAIYIGMGWVAVFAMVPLYHNMSAGAFAWLLAGGILYTVGGVVYALKFKLADWASDSFGEHELFHIFVLLGSFCHFMMNFLYLTAMC